MKKLFPLVMLALISCGGGGGSTDKSPDSNAVTQLGQFVDDPVAGLSYSCSGGGKENTGLTDALGQFNYEPGQVCTFSVGQVVLGAGTAVAADGKITPQDVAGVPRTQTSAPSVLVIAQFLQSLNEASVPGKIVISEASRSSLQAHPLTLTTSTGGVASVNALETALRNAGKNLTPVTTAQSRLDQQLSAGNVDKRAGVPTSTARKFNSLAITSANVSLPVGVTAPLVATAYFSNGDTASWTRDVLWSSSDASVLSVDAQGIMTARAKGSATVSAHYTPTEGAEPITASTLVQVVDASPLQLVIHYISSAVSYAQNTASTLVVATLTWTDQTQQDVSSLVNWLIQKISGEGEGSVLIQTDTRTALASVTPGSTFELVASYLGLVSDRLTLSLAPAPRLPDAATPPSSDAALSTPLIPSDFPQYVLDRYAQGRYQAFTTLSDVNDLTGSLEGMVVFGQSQLIPAKERVAGDKQPRLAAQRKTLLMFKHSGTEPSHSTPVKVKAWAGNGQLLGEKTLLPPVLMPMHPGFSLGIDPDAGVVFSALASNTPVVYAASLSADQSAAQLGMQLAASSTRQLQVQMGDGNWVHSLELPPSGAKEGDQIHIRSSASYTSRAIYRLPNGVSASMPISTGSDLVFRFTQTGWLHNSDFDQTQFIYGYGYWSAVLPKEWIEPGLRLTLTSAQKTGALNNIDIGPPTQLQLNVVDIGLLTPPRNEFDFANSEALQGEYFQKIPASKLVINPYQSVYWTEIVLPTGVRFTDRATDIGGTYDGTLREFIGKRLISGGIISANLGIHVQEPTLNLLTPEITVHNSVGLYANGRVAHGLSGGAGKVTLYSSVGNELSHEIGHAYNLGHYVGGSHDSIHQPAFQTNSTWGWDSVGNRLLPNFSRRPGEARSCWKGSSTDCVPAFNIQGRTYSYGYDAMSGGMASDETVNRYTTHPPSILNMIQQFLENKAVHDPASETGFSQWSETSKKMVPYTHKVNVSKTTTLALDLASMDKPDVIQQRLQEAQNDGVKAEVYDGFWAPRIVVPAANALNQNKYVAVIANAGYPFDVYINDTSVRLYRGTQLTYVSNGVRWVEVDSLPNTLAARKPEAFGVPVTTVVGYYDPLRLISPDNQGFGYVYPALHGAYGHVYAADTVGQASDCHLRVTTVAGERSFNLKNFRVDPAVMNTFHVNIATALQPSRASVYCNNTLIAQRALLPPEQALKTKVYAP